MGKCGLSCYFQRHTEDPAHLVVQVYTFILNFGKLPLHWFFFFLQLETSSRRIDRSALPSYNSPGSARALKRCPGFVIDRDSQDLLKVESSCPCGRVPVPQSAAQTVFGLWGNHDGVSAWHGTATDRTACFRAGKNEVFSPLVSRAQRGLCGG